MFDQQSYESYDFWGKQIMLFESLSSLNWCTVINISDIYEKFAETANFLQYHFSLHVVNYDNMIEFQCSFVENGKSYSYYFLFRGYDENWQQQIQSSIWNNCKFFLRTKCNFQILKFGKSKHLFKKEYWVTQ